MKQFKVALQLYSVRDDMAKDMDATLKAVKEMGYDYVEFAGYFDHTAEEVKAMLDKYDLKAVSVHQGYDVFLQDEKASIDYLKTIGVSYCAVPWMDITKHAGQGQFDQTVADFLKVGAALKEAGIQMLYHNHDFEFETFEGKFLLDWLYESVPADLLKTQIDCCWVKYAGHDPAEYVRKYAGRSPIVHLKDFYADNFGGGPVYELIDDSGKDGAQLTGAEKREKSHFEFRPVGYGVQDIPSILAAAEEAGADIVVVEQDQSVGRPALEAVKMSREYLKSLGQ